jgi:Winged helix DNA-binding domain
VPAVPTSRDNVLAFRQRRQHLLCRDRETLVPDRATRATLWRSIAAPGAVSAGGELVATWRARKKGDTLEVDPTAFGRLPEAAEAAAEAEAARLAPVRSCSTAAVRVS